MFLLKREDRVFHPWLAFVNRLSQQHRRPKGIHCGEMVIPIHFGNVIEHRTEHFVFVDTVVERVDEKLDILLCSDVFQITKNYC